MLTQQADGRWAIDAPAKVNLSLEVLGKRADGYHELESLMVTISLADRLLFEPTAAGERLTCSSPDVGPNDDNLVIRAIRLVRQMSKVASGVAVELQKRIPVAAGLAGGSSDAAATLKALNTLWSLNWPTSRLVELAAQLGSDVPFFFFAPAAIARGRGEILTPIPMGRPLHLVLVCPNTGLKTAGVFKNLTLPTDPIAVEPIARALQQGDSAEVGRRLFNRLEEVSVRLSREVAKIQSAAQTWTCLGRRMTGSGVCYFALCESSLHAQQLGASLAPLNLGQVFVAQSP